MTVPLLDRPVALTVAHWSPRPVALRTRLAARLRRRTEETQDDYDARQW